jgi:hypothetical protein
MILLQVFLSGADDSFEEAVKARDAKAVFLHGAFAQLNSGQELPKC